jgi:hypothetical protein
MAKENKKWLIITSVVAATLSSFLVVPLALSKFALVVIVLDLIGIVTGVAAIRFSKEALNKSRRLYAATWVGISLSVAVLLGLILWLISIIFFSSY